MDADTLKALKESIAKWQRNSRVRKPESYLTSSDDCPLCTLFWSGACVGCPVRKNTGQWYCHGSPYVDADDTWQRWINNPDDAVLANAARKFARDEVAFLQSLLPEDA